MGIIRKMRAVFHEDWCNLCQSEMDVMHKQLYALPDMTVGHYSSHKDPDYYRKHLIPVDKELKFPPGYMPAASTSTVVPNAGTVGQC